MYVDGYSQMQIAQELTRKGIDTAKKYKGYNVKINEWRSDSVSRILKENVHDAIIDKETFEKVQAILEKKFNKPKQKYEYLLRDLVFCGHCGARMQYKSRARTKIRNKRLEPPQLSWYYKCRMVYRFPSICDKGHSINENQLNTIVINALNKKLESISIEEGTNRIIDEYKKNDEKYNLLLKCRRRKMIIRSFIKHK